MLEVAMVSYSFCPLAAYPAWVIVRKAKLFGVDQHLRKRAEALALVWVITEKAIQFTGLRISP